MHKLQNYKELIRREGNWVLTYTDTLSLHLKEKNTKQKKSTQRSNFKPNIINNQEKEKKKKKSP
jgi:hypothetical protein